MSGGIIIYGLAILLAFGASFLTFKAACAVKDSQPDQHVHARQYIKLPPITLSSSSEQAIITITLEVPTDNRDAAEKLQPRLTEAFTQELAAGFSGTGLNKLMQGRTADISAVRVLLMKSAEKIAGPGVIRDLLIDVQQGRT
ncbi:MAG: hypothetical protein EPN97_06815 [Alphaproteobacteria bacterium]|nr:MAG: hypothetical protein EPN97_06815 [Alphaproteobacteria bacterium]